MNNKAVSTIIVTLMLLLVSVSAYTITNNWYQNLVSIKQLEQSAPLESVELLDIDNGLLYVRNYNSFDINYSKIIINNKNCNLNGVLLKNQITKINISNCIFTMDKGSLDIFIQTKSGIFAKNLIKKQNTPLDCSNLDSGEWIKVPGNTNLGISDFCVMKYEAKNVGGIPTSQAASTPWVYVTQPQARTACDNLGDGYHLITNAEWTTIARSAELNHLNWNSGTIGSGSMYKGHSDGSPSNAIAASTNDNDGYFNTVNSPPSTQKRTLILNNSEVIWDIGGNVLEWNNETCIQNSPWYSVAALLEWTSPNLAGIGQEKDIAGPIGSYTSSNGVGMYMGCLTNGNGIIRGSHWNGNSVAGAYTLFMTDAPTNSLNNIGFRCTYSP